MTPTSVPRPYRFLSLVLLVLLALLVTGLALVLPSAPGSHAHPQAHPQAPQLLPGTAQASPYPSPATGDTTVPPASTRFNGSEPADPQPPAF